MHELIAAIWFVAGFSAATCLFLVIERIEKRIGDIIG